MSRIVAKSVAPQLSVLGALALGASLAPSVAMAGNQQVRINEVFAGANGDSSIQFVEIELSANDDEWGPQGGETDSRAILTFHDGTGAETGSYEFLSDPGTGLGRVLIATQGFVDAYVPGADPNFVDFLLPSSMIIGVDGMVCFRANPLNSSAEDVNVCVSYGDFNGNPIESDECNSPVSIGAPAEPRVMASNDRGLPIAVDENALSNAFPVSLTNTSGPFGCGATNADFSLQRPTPENTGAETIPSTDFVAATNDDQGNNIFALETFDGNGRTCQSCHQPVDGFGLSAATIADLFAEDPNGPLFVHLDPMSTFPEIEDDCLMRTNPRGLVLENIDTFANDPVFRSTPHLVNIANTAPYGMGFCPGPSCTPAMAEDKVVTNLRDFCLGAVEQHAPKTVARVSDPSLGMPLDFRFPTDFELAAMEVFQNAIDFAEKAFISGGPLNTANALIAETLVRNPGADSASINSGMTLFFGTARCSLCHAGPAFAIGSFTVPGSFGIANHFDIGTGSDGTNGLTNSIPANRDTECVDGSAMMPGDPLPEEGTGTGDREFNTMPLIGIANTAPFFHDGSATTLADAVEHYNLAAFRDSPAGVELDNQGMAISLGTQDQIDLVNFLSAMTLPEPNAGLLQAAAGVALALLARRRERQR